MIIFWLFTITNWLSYLLWRFPPLFNTIFNINFKLCELSKFITLVTFDETSLSKEKVYSLFHNIFEDVEKTVLFSRCAYRVYDRRRCLFTLIKRMNLNSRMFCVTNKIVWSRYIIVFLWFVIVYIVNILHICNKSNLIWESLRFYYCIP